MPEVCFSSFLPLFDFVTHVGTVGGAGADGGAGGGGVVLGGPCRSHV